MSFTLVTPDSPEEAVRLLAETEPRSVVLAGGTDLLFDLAAGHGHAERVVSLRRLPWRSLSWAGDVLTIGSTMPLSAVERDPRIPRDLPALFESLRAVGSPALRHRASLGGNLARASPASDLIPTLLALDATVAVIGPGGRRTLTLPQLIVGPRTTTLAPGELIEAVVIPEPRPSTYLWQRVRRVNDISQVGVAAAWSPSSARWSVAVGGAWPTPSRLARVEAILSTAEPSSQVIEAAAVAAADAAPFQTDKRASEAYRRQVLRVLVRRAVDRILSGGRP